MLLRSSEEAIAEPRDRDDVQSRYHAFVTALDGSDRRHLRHDRRVEASMRHRRSRRLKLTAE
jgi:hypothetical protein